MDQTKNWKPRVLLVGAVVGAIAGVLAAVILIQRADRENAQPRITAGEGVKLGLGVLGVLKLLSDSSK
jgi:hypothetical protein